MSRSQQGFTLIEMVTVIVILGILAVVAAPRFLAMASEARKADLQGLASSLKQSAQMIYAKAAIEGKESSPSAVIDGVEIANGYPTAKGIVNTLQDPLQWHPYFINVKEFLGWKGSIIELSGVKISTGITLFSLRDLHKLTQDEALKSQCYVMYIDVKPIDMGSVTAPDNKPGFWQKIIQKIKELIHKALVALGIISEQVPSEQNVISSVSLAPQIIIVNDKC